jgi:uncharacterized protein
MRPEILISEDNYFNLLDPGSSKFAIEDIAHALSNLCRFSGHVKEFYSVAQHSVFVSLLVPKQYALQGLLHDAAEAFLGDVSSPLKQLLPDYKAIEKKVEKAVFAALGLPSQLHESVKKADLIMLLTEQRDLMPDHKDAWLVQQMGLLPMAMVICPEQPHQAKHNFLERYKELKDFRWENTI